LRIAIGRTGATKLQELAIGKGTRQHALFAGKTGSGKSTLFHVMITNLALSCSPDEVEFYLIDFKKGVEFKCYGSKKLPHARVVAIESDREFGLSVLQRLDEELKRRGELFRDEGVQDLSAYRNSGKRTMPHCSSLTSFRSSLLRMTVSHKMLLSFSIVSSVRDVHLAFMSY
jgi:DNA segregation ATPase FtsK/SpoIIIE-like protein